MIIRVNVVLSLTLKITEAPVVETSVTINNNESNLWTSSPRRYCFTYLQINFFTERAYYMFIVHVYFKTNT